MQYDILIDNGNGFFVSIGKRETVTEAITWADFVFSGFNGKIKKCEVWRMGKRYYSTDHRVAQVL